jgi:hypothetical protein
LSRRPDGIFVAEFEQGEIGPDLFRKACEFDLEGHIKPAGQSTGLGFRKLTAAEQPLG